MKRTILTLLKIVSIGILSFAQEKAPTPKAKPTKQAATPAAALHDEGLCKAWKMVNYERFSVVNLPTEMEMKDGVTFVSDGAVFLTLQGLQKTGSWSNDKTRTWITLLFDNSEKYKFKINTLTPNQFVFTYQDPDLMSTKYTCEPQKK